MGTLDHLPPPPVWLDHVSIVVPAVTDACAIMTERFGMQPTPTAGAAGRHARIMLHRSYIELTDAGEAQQARDLLSIPLFFLGHRDVRGAIAALRNAGLTDTPATVYQGEDGTWWDGTLAPPEGVPAPVLTQRIGPRDSAAAWPPPLESPHLSGIVGLSAVFVVTPYVAQAVQFYQALIAALTGDGNEAPTAGGGRGGHTPAYRWWNVHLPDGGRIVVCDPVSPGRARDHLRMRGPGVAGIELLSEDLGRTRAFLAGAGVGFQEDEADGAALWLHPAATPGIVFAARGFDPI